MEKKLEGEAPRGPKSPRSSTANDAVQMTRTRELSQGGAMSSTIHPDDVALAREQGWRLVGEAE